ncbi:hypothetical protein ASPZODRAFT_65124 [Penicilliopsis zonata CBS 506.65]|uniref:Uncharacterized protein n=1 Tax=Penicilliopsis zonata CBS 506.65 TaxID=1073090 RepID=A0A1L9SJR2_9EURO|nr:hypothetical protein ASPZODRAFT_65124 [Penicilliopsis zonata CBS 506.65]OJJ47395.1 hypothetical protein ASPZODRAFT_65124 [Penicilliopsis zonata CBS 506.65]
MAAVKKLREMLADREKIIVGPGVYDGLTARMAIQAGFDALYMTGAGTSMSKLGMADLGLATMTEMADQAGMIASLDWRVPLIADADTGYGGALSVGRTVARYMAGGVAAMHLEDQVVNKRCGHLAGKQVVSREEYKSRIRAAVNMRAQLEGDIVLIARTDALQPLGLDEALLRLQDAVELGVDVVFLEAIETREQIETYCRVFRDKGVPIMYGMVQGTNAVKITVAEAQQMGIKILVYAALCLIPTYLAVTQALRHLKQEGDCEQYGPGISPPLVFGVCGMNELLEFDRQAGE